MPALRLESFSVAFSDRTILNDVSLSLAATGATVLVGPSGGGKSTLLRTLSGANDGHASMRIDGTVTVGGVRYRDLATIPPEQRPGLVRQNVRFLIDTVRENLVTALPNRAALLRVEQDDVIVAHLERLGLSELVAQLATSVAELPIVSQRLLALARITLAEPAVLLVDEATASLPDADAERVLSLLRHQAESRAVLFVTHHQGHARSIGGTTCLLNGGRVVALAPTAEFFDAPVAAPVRQFVETGGCTFDTSLVEPNQDDIGEPTANGADAEGADVTDPVASARSAARGPRHFYWALRGSLGGLPRPGIFQDVEHDLEALERVNVTTLVTLEEWESVSRRDVERRGMQLIHFPIVDMKAPDVEEALRMCAELDVRMRQQEVVALHCRAGNGRTGTMLAAMLIYRNTPACDALECVRSVNPKAVESDEQVRFLESFERCVKGRPRAPGRVT